MKTNRKMTNANMVMKETKKNVVYVRRCETGFLIPYHFFYFLYSFEYIKNKNRQQ